MSSSSPPPSPSGMLLPLPRTKADCSISCELPRLLAAFLQELTFRTQGFQVGLLPVPFTLDTNSLRHPFCFHSGGRCCPLGLKPQVQLPSYCSWPHQQVHRTHIQLNSHTPTFCSSYHVLHITANMREDRRTVLSGILYWVL